jgi:GNAT superfamily N-acetyltransferase
VTRFLQAWRARLRRGSDSAAAPDPHASAKRSGAASPGDDAHAAGSRAPSAQDLLYVQEVTAADFFVGELFRRKFHAPPPAFPIHYVSFYRAAPTDIRVIGYVHYSEFEDSYLCGGLVIDDRIYRQMPASHREAIRRGGGIAEHLLKVTFARLGHAAAIWGYVGDTRAERVDARVGFRRTEHPYVMVCWMRELSEEDKRDRMSRVVALGPF